MPVYVVSIVSFVLAVIGTYFKCVEEDAAGKRVSTKWHFPVLTHAGKVMLATLLVSLALSLWVARSTSRTASENQTELRNQLAAAETQLASLRAEQKRGFDAASKQLNEAPHETKEQVVASLAETKSFQLDIFFEDLRLDKDWDRVDHAESQTEHVASVGVRLLRKMLCGFGASVADERLEIPLASRPSIVLFVWVKKRPTEECNIATALVKDAATTQERSLQLEMLGQLNSPPSTRAVFTAFVTEQQVQSLEINPSLTLSSFDGGEGPFFTAGLGTGPEAAASVRYLTEHLPSKMGFNVIMNRGAGNLRIARMFAHPSVRSDAGGLSLRFAQSEADSNWSSLRFLARMPAHSGS
jgi:hypothetical protein